MDHGEAAVLDTRAGQLVRHWAAHSLCITDLACTGEQLITASEVRNPKGKNTECRFTEKQDMPQ